MDDCKDIRPYMIPISLIEIIPLFGGVVTILAVSLKIGKLLQKLDTAIEDLEDIKTDINEIKVQLNEMDKRLTIVETSKLESKGSN